MVSVGSIRESIFVDLTPFPSTVALKKNEANRLIINKWACEKSEQQQQQKDLQLMIVEGPKGGHNTKMEACGTKDRESEHLMPTFCCQQLEWNLLKQASPVGEIF